MSTDRDTTRIVRSWLRTDEHDSADRVLDAVLDRLDTTPQRRSIWWPVRRFPEMNSFAKLGLAAAALAVAALLGFNYLVAPNIGGPNLGGEPESTPTPSPTSYLITNEEGVRVTLALPDGWVRGGWLVNNAGDTRTELTAIQIWAVGDTYTDPCRWAETMLDPPLGPTVDDLAIALENQLTREATSSDVTLDGYSGKLVQMTVPADTAFADCDGGQFRSWGAPSGPDDARFHQGPGQQDDVYILDVDGFRLVIDVLSYPGSPAEDLEKLQQMLDTIQIEPPA
jgi:hypothetical protein